MIYLCDRFLIMLVMLFERESLIYTSSVALVCIIQKSGVIILCNWKYSEHGDSQPLLFCQQSMMTIYYSFWKRITTPHTPMFLFIQFWGFKPIPCISEFGYQTINKYVFCEKDSLATILNSFLKWTLSPVTS